MKGMLVYDSQYGNTEKIARQIAGSLESAGQIKILQVAQVNPEDLQGVELLVVGSPTQRLTATPGIMAWIKSLPPDSLAGVKAAAFDTRFTEEKIKELSSLLAFFVKVFGYAADPIGRELKKKGAELIMPPEGFYVGDTEGPLLEQELDRASAWAQRMVNKDRVP